MVRAQKSKSQAAPSAQFADIEPAKSIFAIDGGLGGAESQIH